MQNYFRHIFCCICFALVADISLAQLAELDRVEPANWWIGMKHTNLQLLVRGKAIAEREVSLNYNGVELVKVHKTDNPNFLFIDLKINATAMAGKFNITFKKNKAKDLVYVYELKERTVANNRNQGVSNKDLIYLLMPDRFANGDESNDVVASLKEKAIKRSEMYARHGGDLQGIIDHLDYLVDLGVTTIWCTPEIENDQPQASYHGYAATDHYKIDPRFGTNDLYKTYVDACHAKGLKVIKDIVHNHIGDEHWMMKDMPTKDWVHQWPSFTQTSYKDQPVMDPYGAAVDKKKTLDGWFVQSMPDMNHYNAFVRNYLIQNHIWWIEYAGIDGLRLDTYLYNDAEFMADWAKKIKAEFPRLGIFGETLVNSVISQAYFTEQTPLRKDFNTELPGITDAVLKDAIYEAVNGKFGWMEGVSKLYSILSTDMAYKDPTKNVVFLDNHDMSRMFSCVGEDFDKYKSANILLLTTRGIPQMYYGTELLMKNFSNPDGLVRSDVMGGWTRDSENKFTEKGRTAKENEAFNFFKKLANYRKTSSALQTGKLMQYVPEDGIYVYFRYDETKTNMIIFNSNDKSIDLNTKRFSERLNSFSKAKNVLNEEKVQDLSKITVPAKTTYLLELEK
jgi:neopullulanase